MNDLIQLIGPGVFLAAPILYAALGGLFTQRAGIFNIALEGFMLLSAYFSILGALLTGSVWTGLLIGIAASVAASLIMAVVVVGFGADEVIVGIAMNLLALGLTTFLFTQAQRGGMRLELDQGFPEFHIPALDGIPVLGEILNNRDVLVWLLLPVILGVVYVFRKTTFGLQLKATGEAPLAARAAGVRVEGVRFLSIVVSGVFCGVAGAHLAIGSVHLFSENMTSGRGIIAFAAVIFGAGLVPRVALACLLFGFAQALAGLLQIRTDFPPQFVLMVPFLLTIVAIIASDALRKNRLPLQRRKRFEKKSTGGSPAPVVLVGHLSIDDIRFPDGRELPSTIGGAVGYAALGTFLAAGDAAIVTRVGEDYPVERLRMADDDCGSIDVSGVSVVPGRSIHHVAWYGADGERRFDIEDFDVMVELTPGPDDLVGRSFDGQWVLVSPGPLDQQESLVRVLRQAGARIALDTELHYFPEKDAVGALQRLTRQVDLFLPSLDHLRRLFGDGACALEELPELARTFECPLVVVKCGEDGVVIVDSVLGADEHVRAVPDRVVVDPTGAGDAFNGGFLAGLARGETPSQAAITGAVSASFVIESIGVEIPRTFSSDERTARHTLLSTPVNPAPNHSTVTTAQ